MIIGAGAGGTAILKLLLNTNHMNVLGVIDINENAPGLLLAKKQNLSVGTNWQEFITKDIHLIFDVTGDLTLFDEDF